MEHPDDAGFPDVDGAEESARRRGDERRDDEAVELALLGGQPPRDRDEELSRLGDREKRPADHEIVARLPGEQLERVVVAPRLADDPRLGGVADDAGRIGDRDRADAGQPGAGRGERSAATWPPAQTARRRGGCAGRAGAATRRRRQTSRACIRTGSTRDSRRAFLPHSASACATTTGRSGGSPTAPAARPPSAWRLRLWTRYLALARAASVVVGQRAVATDVAPAAGRLEDMTASSSRRRRRGA